MIQDIVHIFAMYILAPTIAVASLGLIIGFWALVIVTIYQYFKPKVPTKRGRKIKGNK